MNKLYVYLFLCAAEQLKNGELYVTNKIPPFKTLMTETKPCCFEPTDKTNVIIFLHTQHTAGENFKKCPKF